MNIHVLGLGELWEYVYKVLEIWLLNKKFWLIIQNFSSKCLNHISTWSRDKSAFFPSFIRIVLQERGPLPGPESGLFSNTQKWIVLGDTCWQSKRRYWEGAPGWRAGGYGNPGGPLYHVARSLGFYGDGVNFRVVSGQSFWLSVLPGGTRITRPRWIAAKRILGCW